MESHRLQINTKRAAYCIGEKMQQTAQKCL